MNPTPTSAGTISQVELEMEMYSFGRARTERMMTRNEEGGRADNNPYAKAIYRRFILPMAEIIKDDMKAKRAGRRKAHVSLLETLDPEAVAYLAVRNVLNAMLNPDHRGVISYNSRSVCHTVGKAVYHELLLGLFETASPELFFTLVNDLGRRMSKSERHRMTVFKMQAKANGIPFPEWGPGGVTQVGSYLVDLLANLGMVELVYTTITAARRNAVRQSIEIRLTAEVLELIDQIKGHVTETTPYYLPCVEAPINWTSVSEGGFHTTEMRRMQPYAVRSFGDWDEFNNHDMTVPLAAINALQNVPWQINGRMLDAIRQVARHFDMDEILSHAEFPAPAKPDWLIGGMSVDTMSPSQAEEFIHWKRSKAEWFTQMKLRGTKYGRFYTATSVADRFREFDRVYFMYFADFRGRLYAQTSGVSPQGSDMQKALLHFADGKPLATDSAVLWFKVHGANKWGFDKDTLDNRAAWVTERHELIMGFAEDPVSNDGWTGADCPLQFLAWCYEYRDWKLSPGTFVNRIPVGMDGSCNGLQNFSAMLRDEIGGKATNLVPSELPNDIYQMVADETLRMLKASEEDEGGYRAKWIAHGINRTLVKRSVMTLPYGSTRFSCSDFIVGDYLKAGKALEFPKEEYGRAAQYLSHFVWDAIAVVVVKAREAMEWLQSAARQIIRGEHDEIRWIAPSGFPVTQRYQEQQGHRIRTNLCGNAFLRMNVDADTPDVRRHRNGVAPNFVHSHDAAHLALTVVKSAEQGLILAAIHDDYGTHAADAGTLYRVIREEFISMYESHDPLAELAAIYDLPTPPARGNLDLNQVLSSTYFFA